MEVDGGFIHREEEGNEGFGFVKGLSGGGMVE
jgi:hypothetical protein